MQFSMAVILILIALSLSIKNFFLISCILFFILALASALHDINADGLYITNLDQQLQASFVGIRTLFFQLGRFISQAGLIFMVGLFFNKFGVRTSWQWLLLIFSIFWFIIPIYHSRILPLGKQDDRFPHAKIFESFTNIFKAFFEKEHLTLMILFIVFYNFPENQLLKIVPLFLLDKIAHGGLALSTAQVGFLNGGIGFIGMILGVLFAGHVLGKFSFKKYLLPMTFLMGISNLSYLILSIFHFHSILIIGLFIAFAQFGYGISNGAYMFFLLLVFGRGLYAMSLYTIGTGLMGLGMILAGATSGYLQYLLGYTNFFIWIGILSLAVLLLSFYVVKNKNYKKF